MTSVRPLLRALAAVALLTCVAGRASAGPLDSPDAVLGQWDLTVQGSNKACRMTLRGERMRGGYYLGMPAGCRRAIAPLASAVAWSLPGDERLVIGDAAGSMLLDFQRQADGTLVAITPGGETYRMSFVAAPLSQSAPPTPDLPAVAPLDTPAAIRPAPQRPPLRPADVAGRYAVTRDGGRDTGCMVTLDVSAKAFLAPACRDQGIVTFNPIGWRLVAGKLVLVARKGHTTELAPQPDGSWLKDAPLGKTLGLKRL